MQTQMLELGPQTDEVARIVAGVRDGQLGDPTPCTGTPVAGMLDHVMGLSLAFRMGAEKRPLSGGPQASASDLDPAWRTALPNRLDELAAAWRDPSAWEGFAEVGGAQLPARRWAESPSTRSSCTGGISPSRRGSPPSRTRRPCRRAWSW